MHTCSKRNPIVCNVVSSSILQLTFFSVAHSFSVLCNLSQILIQMLMFTFPPFFAFIEKRTTISNWETTTHMCIGFDAFHMVCEICTWLHESQSRRLDSHYGLANAFNLMCDSLGIPMTRISQKCHFKWTFRNLQNLVGTRATVLDFWSFTNPLYVYLTTTRCAHIHTQIHNLYLEFHEPPNNGVHLHNA